MALPVSTPPLELKQEVYIMAALRGCRLNLVVNFLKYVVQYLYGRPPWLVSDNSYVQRT